jgi:hypothetical protein
LSDTNCIGFDKDMDKKYHVFHVAIVREKGYKEIACGIVLPGSSST